jgi:hypothetical protein
MRDKINFPREDTDTSPLTKFMQILAYIIDINDIYMATRVVLRKY